MKMETISGPAQKPAATPRRVQFSLTELLIFTFYAATILTLYHNSTPDAEIRDDATWIVIVFCGAMLGVLAAGRWRITGFKRRIMIGTATLLFTFLGALHFGDPSYVCWRCCAYREVYGCLIPVTQETETTEQVNKLCGKRCSHAHWKFSNPHKWWYSLMGSRAFQIVPLYTQYDSKAELIELLENLEKIPDQTWRCAAIDALGNPNNKLKYVAMMIVVDLKDRRPANAEEWSAWWAANRRVFVPVTTVQEAMPIAQETVNRLGQLSSGLNAASHQVLFDLPELRIP